jgi:uncharacterized protein YodC (DUF2158 family)
MAGGGEVVVRVGDTVRLGSGGVVMTIERINRAVEQPFAQCAWVDGIKRLQRAFVTLDALEVVRPKGLATTTADCPEARMAGENNNNNNNNSNRR